MIDEETYSVILSRLSQAGDAYQKKDVDAFMSIIAERDDITFIGSSEGDVSVGKEAIRASLDDDFSAFDSITVTFGEFSMSRHSECVVVSVEVDSEIVVGDDVSEVFARQSFVFELINGNWMIVHSHFSFPQEENSL